MNEITQEQAQQVVKDMLEKVHKRFKQELEGENEEFLDRVVRQFRAQVARCSWKASQKWCKWNDDGPVLMPDYTRIYYRKGATEILVQEMPPQVRMMKFSGSLAKRSNSTENMESEAMRAIHHYMLALPYVVFIFKFLEGTFHEVRCAFSDRPLKRLEEKPLRPYLSNLNSDLNVCLGHTFDKSQLERDNLTQQSAFVLSHFWHTSYSDEWSAHFWANKAHFQQQDARLATMEAWQAASTENPLFVIDDVNWMPLSDENFGDIIVRMLENDKENHSLHEDLYSELVNTFLKDVTKVFGENVDAIKSRVVEQMAAQLGEELKASLQPTQT